mmetsp:Transcript_29584/g.44826  ORF Transcript_29584/g.44826 Transcript_29584/m.44826 type:complete len:95 (-) Transcript_29584:298-582(-)
MDLAKATVLVALNQATNLVAIHLVAILEVISLGEAVQVISLGEAVEVISLGEVVEERFSTTMMGLLDMVDFLGVKTGARTKSCVLLDKVKSTNS